MKNDVVGRRLPSLVFCIIAFFGIIFIFITPPIQAPDESSHFTRAAMASLGDIGVICENKICVQMVPESLATFVDSESYLTGQMRRKYSYSRWYTESWRIDSTEPRIPRSYSGLFVSPLMYIPSVAGILTGRLVYWLSPLKKRNLNWLSMMYFARLGNLFAFAFWAALILNYLVDFRGIVAFVCCMPMTVHLASSVHYDPIQLMAALSLFAVVVVVGQREEAISFRERAVLIVSAFFLGHGKAIYTPLLLFVLTLWGNMSIRQVIFLFLQMSFMGILGLLTSSGLVLIGGPWLAAEQAGYLLSHPLTFPQIILRTVYQYTEFYFVSMFGTFGSLDTNLNQAAIMSMWLIFIFVCAADIRKSQIRLISSGAAGLACVFSFIGLMTSMYITWTARSPAGIGAPLVDGVQGRYFLPLIPFLVAALGPLRLLLKEFWFRIDRGFSRVAHLPGLAEFPSFLGVQIIVQVAFLVLTMIVFVFRYWIPDM